jgi:hypothetical protein
MPGLAPGIFACLRHCLQQTRSVCARERCDEAIQSFFLVRDGLPRRCAPRNDDERAGSNSHECNFFILFVDGMFTTFIERAFTNIFEANAQKSALHCV